MSLSSSQLGNSLIDGRTQLSTSIQQTRETQLETSHSHEISLVENYLFPLISETNRAVQPFPIIKIFEYIVLALQIYFLPQYYFFQELFQHSSFTFVNILFFGFASIENFTISLIILFALNALTVFFILFAAILYHNNHESPKLVLSIIRIWDASLYNIMTIPNSLLVGTSFLLLGRDYSALNVFYCILSFICLFCSLYHNYSLNLLLTRSPYLQTLHIQLWRPKDFYNMILIYSFVAAFGIFLRDLPVFCHIIPNILYILFTFYLIPQFLYDNFASIFMNSLFFGISIGGCVSSLLVMMRIISKKLVTKFVFHFVPFLVFLIVVTLIYFLISYRRRKIKKQLQYQSENMTETEKQQYIKSLNIRTENQVYQYLQIGLENASDLFIDWSLHSYLKKTFHDNPSILMVLAWYVAFFRSKSNLMQDFISEISKIVSVSNYDKALFLQLHRVHIHRQSSTNKESNNDYRRLRNLTNRLIAQYSNFWSKIINASTNVKNRNSANDSFYAKMNHDKDILKYDIFYQKITMLRLEADSLWAEARGKYPNNTRLVQEYSRYLLEARCRFRRGLKWKAKDTSLENDQLFYYFRLAFPIYIKQHILDAHGVFIVSQVKKTPNPSASSMSLFSSSESSSSSSSSDDDDKSIHMSSISSDMMETEPISPDMQLKLALERSVDVLKSSNVSRIRIAAIVRLLVTLAYLFTCFGVVLSLFYEKDRFIDCFKYYATSTHYLELAAQQIVWYWAQSFYPQIMSYQVLSETIGPAFSFYMDRFEPNMTRYIYNMSITTLELYSTMAFQTYKESFSSSKELVNLTKFMSNRTIDHNVCYLDKRYEGEIIINPHFYFETKTIPNSITVDFLLRLSILNLMNLSLFTANDRQHWSNEQDFCTYTYQHWDIYNELNGLIQNINPIYRNVMKEYEENNFTSPYLFNNDDDNQTLPITYSTANVDLDRDDINPNLDFITNILIGFTLIVCFILLFPIIIFLTHGIDSEWNSYTNLLSQFAQTSLRDENKDQLTKDCDTKILLQGNSKHFSLPVWLPNFFSCFFIIGVLLLLILLSRTNVQDITHTISQYMLFTQIQNTILQMATDVVFLLFINDITKEDADPIYITTELDKYLSIDNFTQHLDREIDILTITYNLVYYGGPALPSLIGHSSLISDFNLKQKCKPNYNSIFSADYYSCISFESLIGYFIKIVKMILTTPEQFTLTSDIVYNIAFLTRTRFSDSFNEIVNLYERIYTDKVNAFKALAIILCVIAVVVCFVAFAFDLHSIFRIGKSMETLKDLILHIDPIDFANNSDMVSLIYGKDRKINKKVTSATHAIFVTTDYGMILINKDKTIETLNSGAMSVFGFTNEQMLGQHLSFFIPDEDEENHMLYKVMQSMIEGQASLTYSGKAVGLKDNDIKVPLQITLLGFPSNNDPNLFNQANSKFAESFGLLFKDHTDDLTLINSLEKARQQSEQFLLQMFPSPIISQIIKGEKDLSFTSKSASVAFIDVESISTFLDIHNPAIVLDELKTIVNMFDSKLKKYFRLTKVKLDGDCYVVASGLFTNDGMDQLNATQLLTFSLDCINAIDELKPIHHQVRIGIDSGGPVIAGLIGTVSPIFDIIGDTVQNARILQLNSSSGCARISQATYSLSANNLYDFCAADDVVGVNDEVIKTFYVTKEITLKLSPSMELIPPVLEQIINPDEAQNGAIEMDNQLNE